MASQDSQQPTGGRVGPTGMRRYFGPKRATALLVFFLAGAWVWRAWKSGEFDPRMMQGLVAAHPVLAPVLFVLGYALVVVFMVPSLPLNLGAGFLWGSLWGGVYTTLGASLGALIAFLSVRTTFGQPLSRRFDNKLLDWLARHTQEHGWKVVAFVRLNPAIPSGPVNYLFGLTGISCLEFSWATLVFLFPFSYAFAFLGYCVGGLVLEGNVQLLVKLVLVCSAIVCAVVIGRAAYRVLRHNRT